MVVLPSTGGYWVDGGSNEWPQDCHGNDLQRQESATLNKVKLETDDTVKCFRCHFLGKVRIHSLIIVCY